MTKATDRAMNKATVKTRDKTTADNMMQMKKEITKTPIKKIMERITVRTFRRFLPLVKLES